MSGQDPNDQIENLKKQLKKAEERIEKLEQQLQSNAKNNKELRDEKESRENEVSELKQKIKRLEEERKAEKNVVQDILNRMDKMEKESKEQKKELKHVKKDLSYFSKTCQVQESDLKVYMAKTDSLEKSRKILHIGQLCAILMEAVYRVVLPRYFKRDDYKQPHLGNIDKNIEKFGGTDEEKKEARKKWRELQGEIDEDVIMFMEEKLKQRNEEAHPFPLKENELKFERNLPDQEQRHLEKVIQLSKEMTPGILIAS